MPLQVEKTVFISYRRTNVYHARAIFQNLRANGYDVFMDFENIDAGSFEHIILNQIRARAHFLVLLTPSALDRCKNPNDWLRREIETAIQEKRNIVPIYFESFNFDDIQNYLPEHLHILRNYQALRIPMDFFDEAMDRLRNRYLSKPLELIILPVTPAAKVIVDAKIAEQAAKSSVSDSRLTAAEYFEQGYHAQSDGDFLKAMRCYTEGIKEEAENDLMFLRRGFCYYQLERYDDAFVDYSQAIAIDPDCIPAYGNRGEISFYRRNYQAAQQDFEEAIQRMPSYDFARSGLAITYHIQGKTDKAQEIWRQLVAQNANHLDIDWVELEYNWLKPMQKEAHKLIQTLNDEER